MIGLIVFGGFIYFVYLIGKDSGKGPARVANPAPPSAIKLPSGKKAILHIGLVRDMEKVKHTGDAKLAKHVHGVLQRHGYSNADILKMVEYCGIPSMAWQDMIRH